MAVRETLRLFRVGIRQKIDPEFRLLSWRPWRLPRRGQSGLMTRTIGRLADRWATEDPIVLMARLAGWSAEAACRKQDLQPMIHLALGALAERSGDLDGLVGASLAAGMTWELWPLFKASIDTSGGVPPWFADAVAGPARATVLRAALAPGPNREATEAALAALGAQDSFVVEQTVIARGHGGHDWASRALLRHPSAEVRGTASLWFGLDASDHAPPLPDDWYPDWAEAFVVAPLLSIPGGDNHRLGEQLMRLVTRDPDLVESWLRRQLAIDPFATVFRLPGQAQASLSRLPRAHRDRLIRAVSGQPSDGELLSYLIGEDMAWLGQLLDDGVVEAADVLARIHRTSSADSSTMVAGRGSPMIQVMTRP